MPEEFSASLRAGSADFAATVTPAAPDTIRARGNRRRRRQALAATVLAVAIAAGGAGTAYASLGRSGLAAPAAGRQPSAAPSVSAGEGRPDIVAVTNQGALVVLDPLTGIARKILVRGGVLAGAVSVSADGRTVYFAARHGNGCEGTIESIPAAGGRVAVIAPGVLPAISPDGTRVAFVRMPDGCGHLGSAAASPEVVVRDLAGGGETVLPAAPDPASAGAVPELSWSPDGKRLLVAVARSKGTGSWVLAQVDPATARYYLPSAGSGASVVPVTGPDAAHSYYRGGAFLPGGDLFVNRICCTDGVHGESSNLLWEIDPSGRFVRQVAIGWRDRDHTSLDGDPSGQWLLYLSGPDLFLSLEGAAPFKLTTGLAAAAWT
jgi:WD40-like Beta Propeller Repeat